MKKIVLASAVLMSGLAFSQIKEEKEMANVPKAVEMAFQSEFPKTGHHWGTEDGGYEAEFKKDGADASAVYDRKGHRTALEVSVKRDEVPTSALAYIEKEYPNTKITETAKIIDDKNVVTYETEIGKDGKFYDVLFDASGKFIRIAEGD